MSVEIRPGTFQARILSVHMTESTNGVPCMELKVNVESEGKERRIWLYFPSDPQKSKGLEMSMKKAHANGFNGDFTSPAFDREIIEVRCKHEEYNNEMREKWDFSNWGAPKELEGGAVQRLNAMWKKDGYAEKKASPPPATAPPLNPPSTRDAAWMAHTDDGGTAEEWYAFIAKAVPGKEEADFTPLDWGTVMAATRAANAGLSF